MLRSCTNELPGDKKKQDEQKDARNSTPRPNSSKTKKKSQMRHFCTKPCRNVALMSSLLQRSGVAVQQPVRFFGIVRARDEELWG